MQLKGLVRFFTILLILYSIYELSFTWVVRSHERQQMAKAEQLVKASFASADSATLEAAKDSIYKKLLNDTGDETVHYGFTGAISYDKAKQNELNLGLDLKGGINVTLEVDLSGLIRTMANNSKDPRFLQAIENANNRKANSGTDFITLFIEEYKKLNPNGRLAALFSAANSDRIKPGDSDAKVESEIRKSANEAFDITYRKLVQRIDQFGVAQPNINPDSERDIITVELPGVQDIDRVRTNLQSSANLQFWEVYRDDEMMQYWAAAEQAYSNYVSGVTTPVAPDTTGIVNDTSKNANDTSNTAIAKTDSVPAAGQQSLAAQFPELAASGYREVAIRDTAEFRSVLNNTILKVFPPDAKVLFGIPALEGTKKSRNVPIYVLRTKGSDKPPIEGDVVTTASQVFDPVTNKPTVSMDMNHSGSLKWEKLTETSNLERRPIAIVVDDIVYSAPVANDGKITGGRTQISGNFTVEEAQDLANILKIGRLSAPARIVQEQVVGPTLGEDAIVGGITAFIVSFIVIFLLMLIYYNTSGWVANIALILNLLFTVGVLTGLGATLTAPGIAGLVLTIGMAVDTNVLIYERIKEELTKGKSYIQSVNDGYKRSLPPVLDGHVTTLLTAIILFSFGLGPVKGFATTQIIGLLLSLFCGILVSRWVTDWFTNKKRHLQYFTPVSRKIFQHANFKFIEKRKIAYVISIGVIALGIASFYNGFDYGVEFKGGRSYQVRFDQKPNIEQIREDLSKSFGEAPIIKTIGSANQLDITTAYLIDNPSADAGNQVQAKLYEGLKNHLPAGLTFEQFNTKQYQLGSTTVLPTISDDLVDGAKWATIWSLLLISLYIFIRFRDWRYSLGTLAALFHDVLVTLIVFSFAREIVPFPLEIDQHFIAAILTVIGFSMNDTVVIFDRIREYSRQMTGQTKEVIINKAINDTMSRTIMTSLTVFLTILILFLVGGEVTKGFAFAMLIGVLVGIYSSVFVAAPVLVDLGGKKAFNDAAAAPERQPVKKPATAKH
ncbi:MAG TPA: protein translocase subunit SecDF [Flavisolibacter sp.]